MKLFLSPHNDDETLFGAFTIMRERPQVCVVFDSFVQPLRGVSGCQCDIRRAETFAALRELVGTPGASFIGLSDAEDCHPSALAKIVLSRFPGASHVWAPAFHPDGHAQHNAVALAADSAFPGKVTHYLTYTRNGGKQRGGTEIPPSDIARKLRALACYGSQLEMDPRLGCWPHFMRDLSEYVV